MIIASSGEKIRKELPREKKGFGGLPRVLPALRQGPGARPPLKRPRRFLPSPRSGTGSLPLAGRPRALTAAVAKAKVLVQAEGKKCPEVPPKMIE